MSIETLANDPDLEPLWPSILAGRLEGSPAQIAAFAEACSTHGLDELDVGQIAACLRDAGRPCGLPIDVDVGDDMVMLWPGHGYSRSGLLEHWQRVGFDDRPEPLDVWMVTDRNVLGFDVFYHRVPKDTPGAEPYTILSRAPWPEDDDVEDTRAAMREMEGG